MTKLGAILLATASRHYFVPQHYIMGYSFMEWVALFSILGAFITVITWLVKTIIVSPLNAQISILSSKIDEMNKDREKEARATTELIRQHAEMLRDHDKQLIKHEEDIKTLFKRGE